MKPVDQTVFDPRWGNCFAACVASVLEVELERLPGNDTTTAGGWWEVWRQWGAKYNVDFITVENNEQGRHPKGYALAGIRSTRHNEPHVLHSVVVLDGKIVHDPHPDKDGYDKPIVNWILLVPLDPAKLMGRNGSVDSAQFLKLETGTVLYIDEAGYFYVVLPGRGEIEEFANGVH